MPLTLSATDTVDYKAEYEKQVHTNQIFLRQINWQNTEITNLDKQIEKLLQKERERMLFRVPLTNDKGISKDYCLGSVSMAAFIVLLKLATVL